MRTKSLLFALALPGIFVACSDELNEAPGASTNVKGNLIELAPNFALVQNDAATRGEWKVQDGTPIHVWMPVKGEKNVYSPDEIGLAWTGVTYKEDGTVDGVASALGAVSDRVFTNYKFTHFAWKVNGKEPQIKVCPPGGYEGGTVALLQTTYFGADWKLAEGKTLPELGAEDGEPDIKNGLFNTTNSTVYAGRYIAYAPYDNSNTSNYIMATSPAEMAFAKLYKGDNSDKAEVLSDIKNNIFMVGNATISEGGQQTSEFTTKNLSGYVRVKLATNANINVKKVILYDKDASLLTKVGLSASAILDASKSGKDLYLPAATAARETSATITANITDGAMQGTSAAAVTRYLFIPVLPTEASKTVSLILINDDNQYVKKDVTLNVAANSLCAVEFTGISFANAAKLATDETSFLKLTGNWDRENNNFKAAAEAAAEATTVSVLGNIRLAQDHTAAIRGNYTINAFSETDADALVISNEGTTAYDSENGSNLRLTIHNNSSETTVKNPVIKVKMVIEAAGCCERYGGRVAVGNAEIAGKVLVEGQKENGSLVEESLIGADESKVGTAHGWLTFGVNGSRPTISGTIDNYGELNFGRFERTEETGDEDFEAGQVVTTLTGTINNYNIMDIYRVVENKNETTVAPSRLDAKLDVKAGGKLNNAGTFTIEGVLAMSGTGSNEDGTIVDRVSSQVTGVLSGFSNGEYICDVNNGGARFKDAVEGNTKPTTVVRFVEESVTYDFSTVNAAKKESIKKYIVNVPNGKTATLKNVINLEGKDMVVKTGALAFNNYSYYVAAIKDYVTENSKLTVDNLTIEQGATANTQNANVTVKGALSVSGELTVADGRAADEENEVSASTPTVVVIGEEATDLGALVVNKNTTGEAGKVTFENNTETTVYGTITNNGTGTIVQATQTAADIPAKVAYSVKGGNKGNGTWTDGIPSELID